MNTANDQWLLLIVSLPTTSATARMRIWRTLKVLGCGALRDGAYLLPHGASNGQALRDITDQQGGLIGILRDVNDFRQQPQ